MFNFNFLNPVRGAKKASQAAGAAARAANPVRVGQNTGRLARQGVGAAKGAGQAIKDALTDEEKRKREAILQRAKRY